MKKTKIVCTIGPASEDRETLKKMIQAGMNVARLNFSHGTHEEHLEKIKAIDQVRKELGESTAILLDTKGPEIRTGKFNKDEVQIKEGQTFTFTTQEIVGDESKCTVSYKELPQDIKVGDRILVDDGLIEMRADHLTETDVQCTALNSGVLKDNKGVNVPGVKINLPALTEKDKEDIIFGIKNRVDFIAASFVRKREDVIAIRKVLEEYKGRNIKIISKIENQEGVDNLMSILEVSDGLMVARGDLGVEVAPEKIPLIQKHIIKACNEAGKPVITATQMLDSMIRNPRPTRAEVTDVANAILDGTDGIMLSGETAIGKYAIEAVEVMTSIALETEAAIDYDAWFRERSFTRHQSTTSAISQATCSTANDLKASAIVTATSSGTTALAVSKFRPKAPIIASTSDYVTARSLSIVWGVYPVVIEERQSEDEIFKESIDKSIQRKLIKQGNLVIFTAGSPFGIRGTTNMMKVHIASNILFQGIGASRGAVSGRVIVVKGAGELEKKLKKGDIVVAYFLDEEMVPLLKSAGGIILEEGGYYSLGAETGRSLKKPTIVGADRAMKELKDGMIVTVDGSRGIVYEGKSAVL